MDSPTGCTEKLLNIQVYVQYYFYNNVSMRVHIVGGNYKQSFAVQAPPCCICIFVAISNPVFQYLAAFPSIMPMSANTYQFYYDHVLIHHMCWRLGYQSQYSLVT